MSKYRISKANEQYLKSDAINNIRFITDGFHCEAVCYYILNVLDFDQLEDLIRCMAAVKDNIRFFIQDNLLCVNLDLFDDEDILETEKSIFTSIDKYCSRATDDEIFRDGVANSFPTYNINDLDIENIQPIQTIGDDRGCYILSNRNVELLNSTIEVKKSYGATIIISKFPDRITQDFSNIFDGLRSSTLFENCTIVDNIQCIPKQNASIIIKRARAALRYELDQALMTADEFTAESIKNAVELSMLAIQDLEDNGIFCYFDRYIFVYAEDKIQLKEKIKKLTAYLAEHDIRAHRVMMPARHYIDIQVNKCQLGRKFSHMTSIKFPLCVMKHPVIEEITDTMTNTTTDTTTKKTNSYVCAFCGTMYKGELKDGFVPDCPCCGSRELVPIEYKGY